MLAALNIGIIHDADPIDFVRLFLTGELLGLIVEQSNVYPEQYITKEKDNLGKYARASDWKPVTREERIHFLALTLLMDIYKKPSILHYWSTNPLVARIAFKSLMPWNRYPLILSFVNFADNKCYDPLYSRGDRL